MFHYITIGYDCSPSSTLKVLNLRKAALPFDWVVTNVNGLRKCFEEDFKNYHTNLQMSYNKKRMIDYYGFQYPHDYPTTNTLVDYETDDHYYGEEDVKYIVSDWYQYYDKVKEKYNRRIERFKNILHDPKPIIALCRYSTTDVIQIQKLFKEYYNKENVFFVNSCPEPFENQHIINVYTEKNGIWNELALWKETIDRCIVKNALAEPEPEPSQETSEQV